MQDDTTLTVSLGQFDVCWGDPDRNLARVSDWTAEAAHCGSDIVVFPELWDTGYALNRAEELGSTVGEGRFAEAAALARLHRIHIVGSMLELAYPQGITTSAAYNTAIWFGPDGRARGSYRKIHLYRGLEEDRYLLPGDHPHCIDLDWGLTGIAICYDLRFPELIRAYGVAGVKLCVVPAQWPAVRIEHWRTLLRARAIENQMVIAACNRVGHSGDRVFGGHSSIINAWGQAVVEGGDSEELITATVDLAEVENIRETFPVIADRRPDSYSAY